MSEPSQLPRAPAKPAPDARIESWKEIASYLKKGVRTVQRWEREEGLPVHRHLHDKLGTVYAYKAELDAWWQDGHSRLEPAPAGLWFRWRWAALAGVAGMAVALGAWWLWQPDPPELPFEARDWVLVADFENRTGEPVFDGVLDYALERELSNSRFVNVVSRTRVEDILGLMQKPLEARVDAALGREICLRDGGIRALLTGRVEKMDNTYLLGASLVEPNTGRPVASFSEEAEGPREVVSALSRLSNRVRQALGENLALIRESEQKLEKVTTPSLRALQLFSQGSALKEQRQFKLAEEFLTQAIAEDPNFASAHLWLAYALYNQEREYLPHAERAFALSDRVTDQERYFIRGSYYSLKGEHESAAAAYEVLLRIHPDHYFGTINLQSVYEKLGRYAEARRLGLRLADLRPASFGHNASAALDSYRYGLPGAETYLARAQRALTPKIRTSAGHLIAAEIEMLPVYRKWAEGDLDGARRLAAAIAQRLDSPDSNERAAVALHLGGFELTLGRVQAAQDAFQKISGGHVDRGYWLMVGSLARVDERYLAKLASVPFTNYGFLNYVAVSWAAHHGQMARADQIVRKMEANWDFLPAAARPGEVMLSRAEIFMARGARSKGIALMRQVVEKEDFLAPRTYFLAAESLARAWQEQGELELAIRLLEEASGKTSYVNSLNGFVWIRLHWQLVQLYRHAGQNEAAQRAEQELCKRLRYADPGHPILRHWK